MKTARELLIDLANLGLLQADIANGTGLSASTISRIMTGQTDDTGGNNLIALTNFHARRIAEADKLRRRVARAKATT